MNTQQSPIDDLSFEQAQEQLEKIVEQLEDPQTGLDDALALWERGEKLYSVCEKKLDYAAERIEQLRVDDADAARVIAETDADTDFEPAGNDDDGDQLTI